MSLKRIVALTTIIMIIILVQPSVFCQKHQYKIPDKIDPSKLKLVTDLKITAIETGPCQCYQNLVQANAIFPTSISVHVMNAGKVNVATAELTVKYYHLSLSKWVTKKKTIGPLNATSYPSAQIITMVSTPKLIKKSTGITATVKITSTGVVDSDSSNNSRTIKDCVSIVK